MSERIERIKSQLNFLFPTMSEGSLVELESIIERANSNVNEYYVQKLKSSEWPEAADPVVICQQTEEDKRARAAAIYHLFMMSRWDKSIQQRFLDYGCGEGHFAKKVHNEGMELVVGYDIKKQGWERHEEYPNLIFTDDIDVVRQNRPYDIIFLYDVLDHVVNTNPVEVLKEAKSLLTDDGMIMVRFHPWCGRHGTHLWDLNKAYAHLVFNDNELRKLGYESMPTIKILHPREEYPNIIAQAGLRIVWENSVHQQAGHFLNNNPPIKDRVLAHYNGTFGYHDIEEVFRDYILKK